MAEKKATTTRIASIDVFRALTMFLMIFVNDLWSITEVPHWLEHAAYDEDMLGLSDIVFPAFLFIMGMSVPMAIEGRIKKGESKLSILKHIVIRSIALLVMGLFTVNTEYGVAESVGISKSVFVIIMLIGFFLIWNVYPKTEDKKRNTLYLILKITGWAILAVLAFIFRDAKGEIFQTHWWGILGLIGWTYLICATIYLFLRNSLIALAGAMLFFILLCISGINGWLGAFGGIIPSDGCYHAFTMSGLLLSIVFNQSRIKLTLTQKLAGAAAVGVLFLMAGWIAHSWWIVSKIQATPTWLFLCTGISILIYIFTYWLADMKGKAGWFDIIKPAGTATLTCYLIPYLLYAVFILMNLRLPEAITTGIPGLIKCIVFALLTIGITALFNKGGVKLKI